MSRLRLKGGPRRARTRDFDISPFFGIVKPTLESGFDYRTLVWAPDSGEKEVAREPDPKEEHREVP
jgi:hypothetical protein